MNLKKDWGELLSIFLLGVIAGIILSFMVVKSDVNKGNQVIIEKLKIKGDSNEVDVSPDQTKRKWFR